MPSQQFELRNSWTARGYPGDATVEAVMERNRTMPDGYQLHLVPGSGELRVELYAYVGEAITDE